ncbi:MAG TPA: ABC transporter permease [Beijerinckiaceae bacterium]|nr:ABC transporter permease [Beijerinckiaceae bacterium]
MRHDAEPRPFSLLSPALLVITIGLLLPMAMMFRFSLNRYSANELMTQALTFSNYARFFGDAFYLGILGKTIAVALASTFVALVLGVPAAYFLARLSAPRLKSALILMTVIPLLMGNSVRTAGWMVLLGDRGLCNAILIFLGISDEPLRILYTGKAVLIALVGAILPYMIISLQSVLEGIERVYEEAALTLGAHPATMFRRVLLPMLMPGIFSGSLLCFILAMNAYATPLLIGGPTFQMMAPLVYQQLTKVFDWPFASSMAFVLMSVTLASLVLSSVFIQRRYGRL